MEKTKSLKALPSTPDFQTEPKRIYPLELVGIRQVF